jgi:hypothetical protein
VPGVTVNDFPFSTVFKTLPTGEQVVVLVPEKGNSLWSAPLESLALLAAIPIANCVDEQVRIVHVPGGQPRVFVFDASNSDANDGNSTIAPGDAGVCLGRWKSIASGASGGAVTTVAGRTGDVVLDVSDITNSVTTVAGRKGAVVLDVADIANSVTTVAGRKGAVVLDVSDITNSVTTVAGRKGAVTLDVSDVTNAASLDYVSALTAISILGMDPTGATDSTAAIAAAVAALPANGGVLKIPHPGTGFYRFNYVLNKSGVIILGPGFTTSANSPAGGYCAPWDITQPVFQFSDDIALCSGSHIENFCFFSPTGTGYRGLVFAGGAYKCSATNIQSLSFAKSCLEFTNEDVHPCSFNKVFNLTAKTDALYAAAIAYIDKHVSGVGTGWTTACDVIGFSATATNGYQLFCDSAAANLQNGYFQCGYSGHALLLQNNYSGYHPVVFLGNVEIDSVTGTGNVTVTLDVGIDARSSTFQNITALFGTVRTGGNMLVIAGHTLGSITAGQTTLTVSSTTGIIPGRYIQVKGAAAGGRNMLSKVQSISGSVVTLANAAVTTVSSQDVGYGDVTAIEVRGGSGSMLTAPGINFGNCNKEGLGVRNYPVLYAPNSTTTQQPWNDYSPIWDLGVRNMHILGQYAVTPVSSITQSGTTVTVTTTSSHGLATGDLVLIDGVVEPSINGTYSIASYVSATVFTYTSSVSQTLAGVTGSPTLNGYKQAIFNSASGRLELNNRGLALRNHSGVCNPVLYALPNNATLQLQTPDTTAGYLVFTYGSSITTGAGVAFGTPAANKVWFTGNGVMKLIPAATPSTDAANGQIYVSSVDNKWHTRDLAGNDGAILTTAAAAATATTAAPTGTTSATAVMMGCAGTVTTLMSTRVLVTISGQMANSTAGSGATVDLRYGSGTKPANAAAASGTVAGIAQSVVSVSAAQKSGFCISAIVSGLTIGTAYWLDASLLAITSGTATLTGVTLSVVEI